MLPLNSKLDRGTMTLLIETGHSRVPVYGNSRGDIRGALLVKHMVGLDPAHATPFSELPLRELPPVPSNLGLYDVLNLFQLGRSHMAIVRDEDTGDAIGIITLEDVIEELIQEEIIDETDVYVDIAKKVRVARLVRTRSKGTLARSSSTSTSTTYSFQGHPQTQSDVVMEMGGCAEISENIPLEVFSPGASRARRARTPRSDRKVITFAPPSNTQEPPPAVNDTTHSEPPHSTETSATTQQPSYEIASSEQPVTEGGTCVCHTVAQTD